MLDSLVDSIMRESTFKQHSTPADLADAIHHLDLDDDFNDELDIPHEFCLPILHTTDAARNTSKPGHGPFYVVTSGLKEGVFTNWCVS